MSYPPQDPYGAQSGPYPSGSYPTGPYQQPGSSDDFWRHVASSQPPTPPKKSHTGLIIGLVAGGVAVLAAIVVVVVLVAVNSGGRIEAGDCMSLASERGGAMTAARCGSAESDYQVVEVHEGSNHELCTDTYSNVVDGRTYCIVLDVKVGDCLTSFQESEEILPLKLDCSKAEDQVTKVAATDDAENTCDEDEGYYVFSRPARTVCFGDVQGA
ncbi:hypothetical protein GCM10011581_01480 [Saccharopolyspora subtropica]|uniref:Uncharacterized protein n=1 Tax=Saccharopolyspora thermophila TaxID=89367 RepID=A0A917JHQ5_9PSEU|nr:hypothetical protein [Saccharopolyspora subtropica]GGI68277.1 hypothetical protein GCM10011581_01480 [Saccharopolyspora subtropica]